MKVIEKFAYEVIDSGTYKELDYVYLVNKIKALVGEKDEEYDENLSPVKQLVQMAVDHKIIPDDVTSREVLNDELYDLKIPAPSKVNEIFWEKMQKSPKTATDWFYRLCVDNNYVKKEAIAKNIVFSGKSSKNHALEITINLSKPEKDPKAIAAAVNRDDIFLTTKIWVSNMSFEKATKAIDHDLKELGTDYLDLVLLHQPYGDTFGAWNALAAAKRAGKVRSIGLSNFYPDQYMNLELAHEDKPAINQIEINPWFQQTNDVKFFQGRDVAVEAWAQFAEGKHDIFNNKTLKEIAEAHHKTTAQVILRWLTQQDIVVIPKSVHEKRQKENLDIFDFELTKDEMDKIKGLDNGVSQFFDHRDPAVIDDVFGESLKQLRDSE